MQISTQDIQHVLSSAQPIWKEFKNARIFLTGGTGFVGKWLVETFLAANHQFTLNAEMVVLSRDPASFLTAFPHLANHSALVFCKGDVRDFEFPDGEFTHVIHAATDVVAASTPMNTFDVALRGTQRVLEFCEQARATRLLLVSSGAVYGKQSPEIPKVSETHNSAPSTTQISSAYGEGKRAAEWVAFAHSVSKGYSLSIARCFAFVGPHLPIDKHFAIGNFIHDALNDVDIKISGDGTAVRSYLYASDLAIWLWTMLGIAPNGLVLNVGSDECYSIHETALAVKDATQSPKAVRVAKTPESGHKPERYVPDISRAKEVLGLAVSVPLPIAIRRTFDWYKSRKE